MAGHVGVFAIAAEPCHAAVDETRVDGEQLIWTKAKFLQHAGPEWVNENVNMLREALDEGHAARVL